jgi:hypothetical protein
MLEFRRRDGPDGKYTLCWRTAFDGAIAVNPRADVTRNTSTAMRT